MHFHGAKAVALILAGLTLLHCSQETIGATSSDFAEKDQAKISKRALAEIQPCSLLTAEIVAEVFQIDSSLLKPQPFGKTMCTFNWPKPNQVEIDQKNEALMAEFLKKQLHAIQRGETLAQPSLENGYVNVGLTVVDMKDTQRAGDAFDRMVETVGKGITAEKEGVKATFQMIYDQVITDVGDQAAWSSRSKQLSFRVGSVFLHVTVDFDSESAPNLAKAKELAGRILATL